MPRSSGQGVTGRSGGMVRLLGAVLAIVCAQAAVAQQLFAPSFTSTPGTTVAEGALYQYSITVLDADALDTVAITGSTLPSLAHAHGQRQSHGHIDRHAERSKRRPESRHSRRQRRREQRAAELHDHRHCRERSAGLYEHRANGGDPRRALHLYRDGHRSRRRHADICRADAVRAWLTLSGATLSGTPGQANVGTHNVTITVSDGTAPAVAQSFQIVVANVNDPPVFTSTAPTAATQGVAYTYTATATDPDGNTLTFAAPTLSGLAHAIRCDALRHSGSSECRHAQRHDHGIGWHRVCGRAIVPNRRRRRERSAGLHEHRADGGDPRRGLHLHRDGYRSRRQHADVRGADASGLAHADPVRRSQALRPKPTSARTASRSRCRMAPRLPWRNRSKSSSPTRTIHRSLRARRRRRRRKAWSTRTPRRLPIPTATR